MDEPNVKLVRADSKLDICLKSFDQILYTNSEGRQFNFYSVLVYDDIGKNTTETNIRWYRQRNKFLLFSRNQSFGKKVNKNLKLWNILWHLKNVNYICISSLFCQWQRNQRIHDKVVSQKYNAFSDLLEHGSFPSARPGSIFKVCLSCSKSLLSL